jgi:hypothetical protein
MRQATNFVWLGDRLGPRLRGDDEVVGGADQLAASIQNFPASTGRPPG